MASTPSPIVWKSFEASVDMFPILKKNLLERKLDYRSPTTGLHLSESFKQQIIAGPSSYLALICATKSSYIVASIGSASQQKDIHSVPRSQAVDKTMYDWQGAVFYVVDNADKSGWGTTYNNVDDWDKDAQNLGGTLHILFLTLH